MLVGGHLNEAQRWQVRFPLTPTATPTLPGTQLRYADYGARVGSIAFSADGRLALLASAISDHTDGQDFAVLFDVTRGQEIHRLKGHTDHVISVAFSPDGTLALTGSRDTTAILWAVASGQPIRTFKGKHTDWVSGVAFSPDGKSIVTAGKDGQIWLWNAHTGDPVRAFVGHTAWVNTIAFSGDGKYILTGSDDNTARLWDVATGASLQTFEGSGQGINVAALSADGRYEAAGDRADAARQSSALDALNAAMNLAR